MTHHSEHREPEAGARDVIVRPATPADEGALAAIRSAAEDALLEGSPGPIAERESGQFPHRLDIPHGEDYFCLVATAGSTLLGYVSAGGGRDADRKSYAEVYEIAVTPTARRRGIGTRLLREALQLLREASYGGITIWLADGDDGARALVTGAGFSPDGRRLPAARGTGASRYALEP